MMSNKKVKHKDSVVLVGVWVVFKRARMSIDTVTSPIATEAEVLPLAAKATLPPWTVWNVVWSANVFPHCPALHCNSVIVFVS